MITEAVTAISGIKSALDIAKTLIQAKSESERLSAIGDLQTALIEIQQHTLSLQAKLGELQDEAITLRRSNETLLRKAEDLSRYRLVNFSETGASAYQVKPEHVDADEIDHHICPNCFHKGEKSILQANGRALFCQQCSLRIFTRNPPPVRIPGIYR